MDVAAARAEAWLAHQRKRFMRPDAGRYMHPDAARGMRPQADISPRHAVIEAQKDFSPIEAERRALLAAKALAAELKFYLALRRCSRKYRDDQPRDDHGRWVYDGGRRRAGSGQAAEAIENDSPDRARVILAGGISDEQLDLPVQTFIAAYCKASINRVLPGQFRNSTIAEVMAAARSGDRDAATCLKLLMRDKYRK